MIKTGERNNVITVVVMATYVVPFYSWAFYWYMVAGENLQTFHFTVN